MSGNKHIPAPPDNRLKTRSVFSNNQPRLRRPGSQTNTKFTNQGFDERVFVPELCLKEPMLLAELLHLLSEQCQLLCLQPIDLRAVSLTLVVLTWSDDTHSGQLAGSKRCTRNNNQFLWMKQLQPTGWRCSRAATHYISCQFVFCAQGWGEVQHFAEQESWKAQEHLLRPHFVCIWSHSVLVSLQEHAC